MDIKQQTNRKGGDERKRTQLKIEDVEHYTWRGRARVKDIEAERERENDKGKQKEQGGDKETNREK